jgi:glyoxylate/hydroxypyruvate reductase A
MKGQNMTLLLNISDPDRLAAFDAVVGQLVPKVEMVRADGPFDPQAVQFLLTWEPLKDWSTLPNLEVVFSISAGVDQFASLPAHIALVKMVDPHNIERVVDYVIAGCFACLRDFPTYATRQRKADWQPAPARTASQTEVLVLGLGDIGKVAARKLVALGFQVSGWSRSPREVSGVQCVDGPDGYLPILARADIVVCLLPLTADTRGILSQGFFDRMKRGAGLVQAGRGPHCVMADLSQAITSGQIGNAVLDVFDPEPLPQSDPIWTLPNCLITPHVAGRTDALTAAQNVAENLTRQSKGEPMLWQVDRAVGY